MTVLLSVIIPTYGRAEQTLGAVQSVLAQDVDCEILVVDDASPTPDPRLEKLEGVRLIRRPVNGGAGAARNTGLDHARGRFVCFLDSDDRMLPGTLARRLETARTGARDGSGRARIFGCGWREFGERQRRRIPKPSARRTDFFSSCWFAPGSCIIAPASVFSGSGSRFDESLRRLEDFELYARLSINGLELVTDPVIAVEVSIGGAPSEGAVKTAIAQILGSFGDWKKQGRIGEGEIAAARAYLAYELAAIERRNGRVLPALGHLAASLWHKPRLSLFPGPGWM
ncbi:glycosyltransferase family 2 protein [Hoeflea sp.]|uniref:glycosyltransferase family 2 protein n=1 Tax=Hoeflea sp. TaxID=1940281 RepID=UPI003B52C124